MSLLRKGGAWILAGVLASGDFAALCGVWQSASGELAMFPKLEIDRISERLVCIITRPDGSEENCIIFPKKNKRPQENVFITRDPSDKNEIEIVLVHNFGADAQLFVIFVNDQGSGIKVKFFRAHHAQKRLLALTDVASTKRPRLSE